MKEGDIVVMKSDSEESFNYVHYWKKGDKAKLLYKDGGGDWWADFSINDKYYDDGQWCIGNNPNEFTLKGKKDLGCFIDNMKKFSISMIKNTILRRLCVIVFIPIALIAVSMALIFSCLHYFVESFKDFFEYSKNDIDSLIDAIIAAWNGK
jgi:hypothetical protein